MKIGAMRIQCPGCSMVLSAPGTLAGRAVKCPGCGSQMQVPAVEPEPAISVLPAEGNRKTCPACHQTILEVAVKCRHCGQRLDDGPLPAGRAGEAALINYERGMRALGRLLVVIDVLFLLGLVGMMTSGSGDEGNQGVAVMLILVTLGMIVLTVFAFLRRVWANYVVAAAAALLLVHALVRTAQMSEHRVIGFVFTLLLLATIVTSLRNLRLAGKIRAFGLAPQDNP